MKSPDPEKVLKVLDALVIDRDRYKSDLEVVVRNYDTLVKRIDTLALSFGLIDDEVTLDNKINFISQRFEYVVGSYRKILHAIDPALVIEGKLALAMEAMKALDEEREGSSAIMDEYELQNNQLYDNFRNMLHSLRAIIQSQDDTGITLTKVSSILEEYKATLDSFDVSNRLSENQLCFPFMDPMVDGEKKAEEDTQPEILIDAHPWFSKYFRMAGDFLSVAAVLCFGVGSDMSTKSPENSKPAKTVTGEVCLENVSSVSEMCLPQVVTSTIAEFKSTNNFFSDFFSSAYLLVEKINDYLLQDKNSARNNIPPQLFFKDCPEKISYESRDSVSCTYTVSDDDSLDKCVLNYTKEETITVPPEKKEMCAFEVPLNTYCKGGGYPCTLNLQIACYDMEGLKGNVLSKTVIIDKAKEPSCGSKYTITSFKKPANWSKWSCQAVEENLKSGCLSQNQYIDEKTVEKHNLRLGCTSGTLCCPPT